MTLNFILTDEDLASNDLTVTAKLGERVTTWAAPQTVVIELDDDVSEVSAHLSIEQAERLMANLRATIAMARVMRDV